MNNHDPIGGLNAFWQLNMDPLRMLGSVAKQLGHTSIEFLEFDAHKFLIVLNLYRLGMRNVSRTDSASN